MAGWSDRCCLGEQRLTSRPAGIKLFPDSANKPIVITFLMVLATAAAELQATEANFRSHLERLATQVAASNVRWTGHTFVPRLKLDRRETAQPKRAEGDRV